GLKVSIVDSFMAIEAGADC
ncbi:hypothetical protein Tco_0015566, partial [Tanacetum coccineum]